MIRKPRSPRVNEYPGSYDDVVKLLRRREAKGEVKRHRATNPYEPDLWSRPSVKTVSPAFRAHEMGCGDIFVKMWPHRGTRLTHWSWEWDTEELEEYGVHKKQSFLFDRRMNFDGRWFFWEHDRDTRDIDKVAAQVRNYRLFGEKYFHRPFHVLYTVAHDPYGVPITAEEKSAKSIERCNEILEVLSDVRHGNQFLVALHSDVLDDPLAPVFVSPLNPQTPLSITQLTA